MTYLIRNALLISVIGVYLGISTQAIAQYKWREDGGRIVYSDIPPPPSIKRNQILQQPGAPLFAAPSIPTQASAVTENAATSPQTASQVKSNQALTASEKYDALQKSKQDQDKKAALQKQAAEQQAAKQDNCNRIRNNIITLESGVMIRNPEGGKGDVMSDAQKQSELSRAKSLLSSQGC